MNKDDYNYRNSGVSKDEWLEYANEYGGSPQFDRHGVYIGSVFGPFDNTQHQDHGEA